jgi:hypothetical protein
MLSILMRSIKDARVIEGIVMIAQHKSAGLCEMWLIKYAKG